MRKIKLQAKLKDLKTYMSRCSIFVIYNEIEDGLYPSIKQISMFHTLTSLKA